MGKIDALMHQLGRVFDNIKVASRDVTTRHDPIEIQKRTADADYQERAQRKTYGRDRAPTES
jgi:hypothetical protein